MIFKAATITTMAMLILVKLWAMLQLCSYRTLASQAGIPTLITVRQGAPDRMTGAKSTDSVSLTNSTSLTSPYAPSTSNDGDKSVLNQVAISELPNQQYRKSINQRRSPPTGLQDFAGLLHQGGT